LGGGIDVVGDAASRLDVIILWCLVALSALSGLAARLAMRLFHIDQVPPTDFEQLKSWKRRRWYMIVSEVSALPAFATFWIAASMQWHLSVPLIVIGSMISGALGFGFLIHALQIYVLRKANNGS
jgi:hypothetical protein